MFLCLAESTWVFFGIRHHLQIVKTQVRTTQTGIKQVLRERWDAWNEARELYDEGYRPSKEEPLMDKENYLDDSLMESDTLTSHKSPTSPWRKLS